MKDVEATDPGHADPSRARALFRSERLAGVTSGLCLGHLQANLVMLPAEAAAEFEEFCRANPRPLPLVEVCDPGDPTPRRAAPGADLRSDLPRYRVYRHGEVAGEPTDVRDLWRDDMVAFLLGCSFTLEAGVRLRHCEQGRNVPMFETSVACAPVGRFHGRVVVSMRPIERSSVDVARQVTSEYPLAHGSPLQVGEPEAIGIADLARPDYGDAIEPSADEVAVFWACGVTSQSVIRSVRPELAITHAPGHMFITDVPDSAIRFRSSLPAGGSP
jgi:uncharacterized protein YcsI (UPF0317 family)